MGKIISTWILFRINLASVIIVGGFSLLNCFLWSYALTNFDWVSQIFRPSSSTFDLLNLVVGFTYVGVVRASLNTLRETSKLYTRIELLLSSTPTLTIKLLRIALHLECDSEEDEKVKCHRCLCVKHPHKASSVKSDIRQLRNFPKWKKVYEDIYLDEESETGLFFQVAGPYLAMFVYFVVHPALVYTETFIEWALTYTVSVTVLFSFVLTLSFIEKFLLKRRYKHHIVDRVFDNYQLHNDDDDDDDDEQGKGFIQRNYNHTLRLF